MQSTDKGFCKIIIRTLIGYNENTIVYCLLTFSSCIAIINNCSTSVCNLQNSFPIHKPGRYNVLSIDVIGNNPGPLRRL